jgi:PAS domain S-box-containing protein
MGWFGGGKDKTAAPKAALAADLQDEKQRSQIILNAIDDGVTLIAPDGTIQMFNPAAVAITGWPAEDATGLQWQNVFKLVNEKNEEYPDQKNPFIQVFNSPEPFRDNDAFLSTRGNKQIPISLSLTPLTDPQGNHTAVVAIFRDVTKERQEEKQRADFISTASHEMRTPVAAIEGYLALAMNNKVATIDSRAMSYLEKAHTSTQHLGRLFQDLLTSAKAEDGRLTSHPVAVEIGAFLESLAGDLKFSAEKKGLQMEFVLGSSDTIDATNTRNVVKPLYYTKVDPDRLREVVTNIFDNGVKYTDTGKVTLGMTGDDKVVQIYVKDTGPGIPAEDIGHLFQKFYRVDNSATRTIGGTGLGLFICRKIVELYGGRIWAESEVGKGSSFFINLPRITTAQAQELQKQESAQTSVESLQAAAASVVQ